MTNISNDRNPDLEVPIRIQRINVVTGTVVGDSESGCLCNRGGPERNPRTLGCTVLCYVVKGVEDRG